MKLLLGSMFSSIMMLVITSSLGDYIKWTCLALLFVGLMKFLMEERKKEDEKMKNQVC